MIPGLEVPFPVESDFPFQPVLFFQSSSVFFHRRARFPVSHAHFFRSSLKSTKIVYGDVAGKPVPFFFSFPPLFFPAIVFSSPGGRRRFNVPFRRLVFLGSSFPSGLPFRLFGTLRSIFRSFRGIRLNAFTGFLFTAFFLGWCISHVSFESIKPDAHPLGFPGSGETPF